MCRYSVSIDDVIMEEIRPSITSGIEENVWVELQVRDLFEQMAEKARKHKNHKSSISQRLRGIGHAPEGFDYKKELEDRFSNEETLSC